MAQQTPIPLFDNSGQGHHNRALCQHNRNGADASDAEISCLTPQLRFY